jgi:CubicO group peptidase (beta-lactamase class C family)
MPEGTPIELGLAGTAKVMCSAIFVSQRVPEEAWTHSAQQAFMPSDAGVVAEYRIDVPNGVVTIAAQGLERRARFHGDQGCIIGDALHFEPMKVERKGGSETADWPMGDVTGPLDPTFDAATDAAFSDPEALTAAFIVLHEGRIVAERYGPGVTRDTALESWSMGKSITATLLALLVKDGVYDVGAPVPVERWANDSRKNIRIIDLLHMSSGLYFRSALDPDFKPEQGYPDHSYVYTGAVDVFEYSLDKPAQFPPNTQGRYRNSDPLIVGWLIKRAVGAEYLRWPQRALFDRLGMRHMVLETDPYGNFVMTGYDYGTARDWARLGLLYAQDGVWLGERVLPEGWTKLISTPAPAWKKREYGGLFWVNGDKDFPPLPETAYSMVGAGGQRVFVVPEHQLVVVRMGHARGWPKGKQSLTKALELVMKAVGK